MLGYRDGEAMNRWVTFIIEQKLLFLLLTAATLVLSLFIVRGLNIEAFPDPAPAIIEIVTIYEGRSAEEVERQITLQLEVGLAGMPELERLNSISLYGLSDIKCKFSYNLAYKDARQEVINRLAGVQLPANVQPQIVANGSGETMRFRMAGSNNLLEQRTLLDWNVARHLKTARRGRRRFGLGRIHKGLYSHCPARKPHQIRGDSSSGDRRLIKGQSQCRGKNYCDGRPVLHNQRDRSHKEP